VGRPRRSRAAGSSDADQQRQGSKTAVAARPTAPGDHRPGSQLWPPASDDRRPAVARRRSTVALIGYGMGPVAMVVLLVLRHFGEIDRLPVWEYVVTFAVVPAASLLVDRLALGHPESALRAQVRHAVNAAAVAWIIYMTGWGPVLVTAYAIVVVDSCARQGARAWRATTAWSLVAVLLAQGGIAVGLVPTRFSPQSAQVLALLGLVVLIFISRLVGAAAEQAEQAEEAVRHSEERFRALVQHSSDTTFIVDPDGAIRFVSPAVVPLLGRDPAALVGVVATDLVHPDDRPRLTAATTGRFTDSAGSVSEPIELRMAHADGSWRPVEVVVSDQRGHPAVGGYVCNARDIAERAETQALLAHRATHDPLTGLPNRHLLVDRIEQAVARRRRQGGPQPVVMLLDLDRFKLVNDGLGHQAGDHALVELAGRLRTVVRDGDTVARLGGDEFVLLCEDVADRPSAIALARRVVEAVEQPLDIDGRHCSLGASVGITFVDDDDHDAEALLAEADFAMYLAKDQEGGNQVRFFDAAARAEAGRRVNTQRDLTRALDEGQFVLYYQPIVAAADGRVVGAEALLRWRHPQLGVLTPDQFLGTAERTGLIVPIGTWVLRQACAQLRSWNQARPPEAAVSVSVNLSGRQLGEPALVEVVADALAGATDAAGTVRVGLELTESMLPSDDARARRTLRQLHALGVALAIDDFGNGYSSLRYVRDLPIDMLKIDRSFVSGIGTSPRDESIIRSVVTMAKELGLSVTAEGVETERQVTFLQAIGCQLLQGFYFGRPQPADTEPLPLALALPQGGDHPAGPGSTPMTATPDALQTLPVAG